MNFYVFEKKSLLLTMAEKYSKSSS